MDGGTSKGASPQDPSSAPAEDGVVAKVMAENDQMQTLLQEVVLSYPFQYKMNRPNHVATTEKP